MTCAAEKHLVSEKPLNKWFFKGTGVVLAGIERSPKIRDFRASGIPVQECVEIFDTLKERLRFFLCFVRRLKTLSVFLFFELKRIEKSNQMYYN